VYGVAVPGTEGRAGMAALVVDGELDLPALRKHLADCLPEYAHPMFLRIMNEIGVTVTFKHRKRDLMRQGYDPMVIQDAIYFNDRGRGGFVRLDKARYDRIQAGMVRL
jgi:fatty-acyl-CoA synthase